MLDTRVEITNPKDRGFVLPVGIFDGKVPKRDFSLREMEYPVEKAIGRFRRLNPDLPSTATVTKVVSLMLTSLAGKPVNFQPDDTEEQEAEAFIQIGGMFLADVYYIYVMARIEELGTDYEIEYGCSGCNFTGKMTIDLNTMDVHAVNDLSILRRKVSLLKGIKCRNGNLEKTVLVQPMVWANMVTKELNEFSGNQQLMKLHFIKHCVVGVDGFQDGNGKQIIAPLSDEELASLRKIDIEILGRDIDSTNIGPKLIVEGKCPNEDCKAPFLWPIDWEYDSFFTISSLS